MRDVIPTMPNTIEEWLFQFNSAYAAVLRAQQPVPPVDRLPPLTEEEMQQGYQAQARG